MPRRKPEQEPDRVLVAGIPDFERCDNKVVSARYTLYNFFPKAILEQFRRFANLYFLGVGIVMFIGTYTPLFESAISPWTTLGPLSIVISISLLVEGSSDYRRHLNDAVVNNSKVVVVQSVDDEAEDPIERDTNIHDGRDVFVNVNKAYYSNNSTSVRGLRQRTMTDPNDPAAEIVRVAFCKIKRKEVRQGQFVLVRNREMVPADLVLLASANDRGGAYIETSSIDGETNLKLRNSPQLPPNVLKALRDGTSLASIQETGEEEHDHKLKPEFESLEAATKRLTRFSSLGRPDGKPAHTHPSVEETSPSKPQSSGKLKFSPQRRLSRRRSSRAAETNPEEDAKYIASLTTEPPNASVHTFSGKLTLPPFGEGSCYEIPLGADNVLLRGAVIRNTEWIIGLVFFTGNETKLVQNSFETPSKFSQLDQIMNRTVISMLMLMVLLMSYLATAAVITNKESFNDLFYAGFNQDGDEPWPYLPDLKAPAWTTSTYNWLQYFFLFITLVSNLIPLSLYVTIEIVQFVMLWFMNVDIEMYDDHTDTKAQARSTIVSDLGRIQYIFSDKTGTLTQNVMRFKRCSVDGMAFGAPIQKSRPGVEVEQHSSFHPLRQLLVGSGNEATEPETLSDGKLTFHAEMFLRVMSLCHTVVVEKDIDSSDQIRSGGSTVSQGSARSVSSITRFLSRKRNDFSGSFGTSLHKVEEEPPELDGGENGFNRQRLDTDHSLPPDQDPKFAKGNDGAPLGYAYQAESPDEGALVSAASVEFDFQVVARDLNGICLRTSVPSHFADERIVEGIRSQSLSLDRMAAETAVELPEVGSATDVPTDPNAKTAKKDYREETWSILAVNKFDSDRKRMSVLLRSPSELGGLPILFCKGADSSMLDPAVCGGSAIIQNDDGITMNTSLDLSAVNEHPELASDVDEVGHGVARSLGMQMHLGEFAKEGLRTLVLGIRILTENECSEWLKVYEAAATSMANRDEMMADAALQIERDIHIVGATAIEDKLQKNVPQTIQTLGRAGIKLWVLTGDKRETAVEIGYSTNVLTSKMCLTEVADRGYDYVRTQVAMEFIRLTKLGKLTSYQTSALGSTEKKSFRKRMKDRNDEFYFYLGKLVRRFDRLVMRVMASLMSLCRMKDAAEYQREQVAELEAVERKIIPDKERRQKVRYRADLTIKEWQKRETSSGRSPGRRGSINPRMSDDDDISLASDDVPAVFNKAASARALLNEIRSSGELSKHEARELSIAYLTAQQVEQAGQSEELPLIDDDLLSLDSFMPQSSGDIRGQFDKKKRTILERMFAIDRQVRKGRLKKHLTRERLRELAAQSEQFSKLASPSDLASTGPRGLVIEGAALKHLLGDKEFEEILFAVASCCDAVIACRVSPKQKAELVNLVRENVKPEPITLAIGDGANDVGMIQEAHVGVGVSGKEGTQAVNASDFSIAQFRFLETLILIHGRWNFFRLSTVVLFSFYKNAVMSGVIIAFASRTVYSGTPVFDEWVVAMLNFVAAFPIIFTGIFDRCLSKRYVREHPEAYRATRDNELFTFRSFGRWGFLCVSHILVLYFFTIPQQSFAGGMTSAFQGLMVNEDRSVPGDGEGGDLKSVGTVTYICMIVLLAYKVLYESRSLLHGRWPAFTCRKDKGEGVLNRLAYTWIGVTFLSIGFFLWAIVIYSLLGRRGASGFSNYTDVAFHVMPTRSMTWMIVAFVPLMGVVFDVVLKVFSNMYFPTQTQIHIEAEAHRRATDSGRKEASQIVRRTRQQLEREQKKRESAAGSPSKVDGRFPSRIALDNHEDALDQASLGAGYESLEI